MRAPQRDRRGRVRRPAAVRPHPGAAPPQERGAQGWLRTPPISSWERVQAVFTPKAQARS